MEGRRDALREDVMTSLNDVISRVTLLLAAARSLNVNGGKLTL